MTDRETIRAMFDRAGVVYSEGATRGPSRPEDVPPNAHPSWLEGSEPWRLGATTAIEVEAGESDRNLGYGGFVAVFYFDEAGSLKAAGMWE